MCRIFSYFIIFVSLILFSACSRQPVYPAPAIEGGNAVIDASTLKPEVPQFYAYQWKGRHISFFVVKLNDQVLSFLDACASCYPHRRGYKYEDGDVVCRSCGLKFSVFKLEQGIGGCFPIRIQGRTENGRYLIPLVALEAEASKF